VKQIKLSEISAKGNFEPIIEKLREFLNEIKLECEESNSLSPRMKNFFTCIVVDLGLLESLEEGIVLKDVWDHDEAVSTLLSVKLLLIEANTVAHRYVNNLELSKEQELQQLNDTIRSKPEVYGDIEVVAG